MENEFDFKVNYTYNKKRLNSHYWTVDLPDGRQLSGLAKDLDSMKEQVKREVKAFGNCDDVWFPEDKKPEVTDLSDPDIRKQWNAQKREVLKALKQEAASLAPLTKPLMPKGRIGFYWPGTQGKWEWRVYLGGNCIEAGDSNNETKAYKLLKGSRGVAPVSIHKCRPEDHYRKPEESEQRAPVARYHVYYVAVVGGGIDSFQVWKNGHLVEEDLAGRTTWPEFISYLDKEYGNQGGWCWGDKDSSLGQKEPHYGTRKTRQSLSWPSEQRVTPQEGAQTITQGYLSESNDYWDKGNYWSGQTWEKELDAILAPLNLDQRIRVLESVRGAVHPEEIKESDRDIQIARRDSVSQSLFIAGILCLVAMIPVGAVTMSLFAILGCAVAWLISWGISFAVDPYS
jgi:hypothetical protein